MAVTLPSHRRDSTDTVPSQYRHTTFEVSDPDNGDAALSTGDVFLLRFDKDVDQRGRTALLGSAPARPVSASARQCPSARLAALGRLGTPRARPSHRAPIHRLEGSIGPPPKSLS